jgi:hypothetical protein
MVLGRVANLFTNGDATNNLVDDSRRNVANTVHKAESAMSHTAERMVEEEIDMDAIRPPYLHVRMPSRGI